MTSTVTQFDGIKLRQQRMWASGDYSAVAASIHPLAEWLCEDADLAAGARVLDVANGPETPRRRPRAAAAAAKP